MSKYFLRTDINETTTPKDILFPLAMGRATPKDELYPNYFRSPDSRSISLLQFINSSLENGSITIPDSAPASIYTGSGTVPSSVVATLTDSLKIDAGDFYSE